MTLAFLNTQCQLTDYFKRDICNVNVLFRISTVRGVPELPSEQHSEMPSDLPSDVTSDMTPVLPSELSDG